LECGGKPPHSKKFYHLRMRCALLFTFSILASVQLDPQTGLWFPPYASKVEYLNRDPAHPYMRDLDRAFSENAVLANEVCAAFLAAPEPQTAQSNDPSVRQFRAMFAMKCTGRQANTRRQTEAGERMKSALDDLQTMFDQEEHAIVTIDARRRTALSENLVNVIDNGSGPSLRPALRAIALFPRYTFAIHSLMALPDHRLTDGTRGVTRAQAAAFIEQLYRARASANSDADWRAGLPAVLLFEGKLDEARKAADEWYAMAPRDRASYARAMLSVIDRALGREGTLDKVAAGCSASASWREQNPDGDPSEYCKQSAAMLVINALDIREESAPHGLADAAFELERIMSDDWPFRLTLIAKAGAVEPRGAQKRFYAMLAEKDIPGAASIDAVYYLAKLAAVHDHLRVAPLVDCWIRMQRIAIPDASPETWKRIAAMSPQGGRKPGQCSGGAADSWCVMHALTMRLTASIDAKQWNLAKQTIEKMAAITVSSNGNPTAIRSELIDFAVAEIRNGRRADAVAILSYLKGQPEDGYVTSELAHWADGISPGTPQPWQTPVSVDRMLLSDTCPPQPPAAEISR
jgi:hypothetical protein